MKIYVASSWRNQYQPRVVQLLRSEDHDVYDFRHPDDAGVPGGFQWSQIPNWRDWPAAAFRECLTHPIAANGYDRDMAALLGALVVVLVLPCNRSAHLEAGIAIGMGKRVVFYYPPDVERQEPELMYRAGTIAVSEAELLHAIAIPAFGPRGFTPPPFRLSDTRAQRRNEK